MFCAISGEVPREPVVSSKTGMIYEKRLVVKALAASALNEGVSKCPVTGKEMSEDDLVAVKGVSSAVKPRLAEATSVPSMLAMFQNEWDSLVLESFKLRKSLDEARRELAQHLYQYDAACRVIARVVKERDSYKRLLLEGGGTDAAAAVKEIEASSSNQQEDAQPAAGANGAEAQMDVTSEASGGANGRAIPQDIFKKIADASQELTKGRRGRKFPADLAPEKTIKHWDETENHRLHSATSNKSEVHAVDVHPSNGNMIVTGGSDAMVMVYDRSSGQVVRQLDGHSRRITAVAFHPQRENIILSCAQDKTAKMWKEETAVQTFHHEKDVTDCALHPTGDYLYTSSLDKTWKMFDIDSGATLLHICDADASSKNEHVECIASHPDGLLVATGSRTGAVRLFDINNNGKCAVTFEDHGSSVTSLCFSENGYHMASGGQDGVVRLWDLRKLKCTKSFTLDAGMPTSVAFDASGKYLAYTTSKGSASVRTVKTWKAIADIKASHRKLTDCAFGPSASFLATVSVDRYLKVFS